MVMSVHAMTNSTQRKFTIRITASWDRVKSLYTPATSNYFSMAMGLDLA